MISKLTRQQSLLTVMGITLLLWALSSCNQANPAGTLPTLVATAIAQQTSPTVTRPGLTFTPVPILTFTPVPTLTDTPGGPSRTPTRPPTRTVIPSPTPVPTLTPTPAPQFANPIADFDSSEGVIPATAIPTAVPTFETLPGVTNILLLGSDDPLGNGISNTDTMIIVSINRNEGTAAMVSLPRDLYVYIPGWTMNRLNTAMLHGSSVGYPTGPVGQLKDTILYNFGVPIHYYARVDFAGFKQAVDAIGGVEMAVSCRLEDWRLKSPELDPQVEENWEIFSLEPGLHQMNGDLALWYARSRRTTSDFDRGRRQQQLLRAILNKGVDLDLLPQVPTLYNTFRENVDTDMDIGRILQLASLAPSVRQNGVQHLYIIGDQLQPWQVPDSGAAVQLPRWENMQKTFERLLTPSLLNQANRVPIYVEIVNGTTNPDLAVLAADNLAWYGFIPVITPSEDQTVTTTTISYFGNNLKGSLDWFVSWIFHQQDSDIQLMSDTAHDYEYRVVLGSDYDPCLNQFSAPLP